jgi:Holliday junction DNA helicase RuvA
MISYLEGQVRRMPVDGPVMVLLVGGIGYEITLPTFVHHGLQERNIVDGDTIGLEIYYHVTDRQPKPVLVGFQDTKQKTFFERLIGVEGVGPSKAAAALIFPVADIARAIEDEDSTLLRRMPGIGDRAAQKIIASLRGKVTDWAMDASSSSEAAPAKPAEVDPKDAVVQEGVDILVGLGHRPNDAKVAISKVLESDPELADDIEALIREVFRSLTGVA